MESEKKQQNSVTDGSRHMLAAEIIYRILKAGGWQQGRVDDYCGIIGIDMHKDGQVITLVQDFYPNQVFIRCKQDLCGKIKT